MSGQGATLGGSNGGIVLAPLDGMSLRDARKRVGLLLRGLGIEAIVDVAEPPLGLGPGLRCWLTPGLSAIELPMGDRPETASFILVSGQRQYQVGLLPRPSWALRWSAQAASASQRRDAARRHEGDTDQRELVDGLHGRSTVRRSEVPALDVGR